MIIISISLLLNLIKSLTYALNKKYRELIYHKRIKNLGRQKTSLRDKLLRINK